MNLEQIIKDEIFENKKSSHVVIKLSGLFTAFNTNKQVLLSVEKYYCENVLNNKIFPEENAKKVFNLLKKTWLNYWITENVEKEDLEVIKRYFPKYLPTQQAKLNKVVKEKLGQSLEVKEQSLLTIALKDYRRGHLNKLEIFINSTQEITLRELDRIKEAMHYNRFLDNSLPIWVEAVNKCAKMGNKGSFFCFLPNEKLFTQPSEHIEQYIMSSIENYKKYTIKQNSPLPKSEIKKFVAKRILNMEYERKYTALGTIGDLLYDLSKIANENVDIMPLAFKNMDYLLRLLEPSFSSNLCKKFHIKKQPNCENLVQYLFEIIDQVIENFDEIHYYNVGDLTEKEFEQKAKEVESVYHYNRLHNKYISNEKINMIPIVESLKKRKI